MSEETKEQDLRDLFGHFGPIHRVYLAKDKTMQRSKVTTSLKSQYIITVILIQGFAFINYYKRTDAQMAIQELDGHGYDHLILKVEWAKLVIYNINTKCNAYSFVHTDHLGETNIPNLYLHNYKLYKNNLSINIWLH